MACTLAFVTVLWIAYPQWRWFYIVVALWVTIGQIGMNYHFVGDCVGGSVLGSAITGAYAGRIGLCEVPAPCCP